MTLRNVGILAQLSSFLFLFPSPLCRRSDEAFPTIFINLKLRR
jgi:hypothetical protein